MPKKAFITGISGFTGFHMTEFLMERDIIVGGIDRHNGKLANLNNLKKKLEHWFCDLSQKQKLKKILIKFLPDYVFHFASPLIRTSEFNKRNLEKNLEIDLSATLEFLKILTLMPKKPKVLITGTNAEYQIGNKPLKENFPLYPQTPYGLSKLAQEIASLTFAKSNYLPLFYTRTFHLVGPCQKPTFVISDFAKQIARIEKGFGKPVLFTGNQSIKRDFTDVRDAITAYWLIVNQGKSYFPYNVCSQETHSIEEVINFLLSQIKVKVKIIEDQRRFRLEDPLKIIGNNQTLRDLGWKKQYSFRKSLLDTLNYWRTFLKTSK